MCQTLFIRHGEEFLLRVRRENVVLTPAQLNFCKNNIAHFSTDRMIVTVAGKAGSDRSFLRISPEQDDSLSSILILWNSSDADWNRFITIQKEVASQITLLPEIYAIEESHGLILEEDCGRHTVKDFCQNETNSESVEILYKKILKMLIQWQDIDVGISPEIGTRIMDKEMFLWETDYFATHCVSEYFGLDSMLNDQWDIDREKLADSVALLSRVCLHRDFQSENIVLHNGTIKFVDYQGARLGAAEYDLASLLFDPYVSVLNDDLRKKLFDYYVQTSGRSITRETFCMAAIQRLCQALGAYGNLSLHKNKEQYKKYIPLALFQLLPLLDEISKYPQLKKIVRKCCSMSSQ